jgi:tetratricopeptide (TPR) repeat protein
MGCGWSATLPELKCRTLLQLGDSEWERQRFEVAQARYREAAEADPWSTEPLERLAESALQRAQQSQAATDFAAAIQYQQQLIERLPFASRTYRRWGHMWRQWFEQSRDPRHAQAAAEAFREAVGRYPHHAELLAEWAIACELAGFRDDARFAAARALRQDGINRAAGHSDKYLSEATRQRLQSLSNDGISSQDAN